MFEGSYRRKRRSASRGNAAKFPRTTEDGISSLLGTLLEYRSSTSPVSVLPFPGQLAANIPTKRIGRREKIKKKKTRSESCVKTATREIAFKGRELTRDYTKSPREETVRITRMYGNSRGENNIVQIHGWSNNIVKMNPLRHNIEMPEWLQFERNSELPRQVWVWIFSFHSLNWRLIQILCYVLIYNCTVCLYILCTIYVYSTMYVSSTHYIIYILFYYILIYNCTIKLYTTYI